MLWVGRMNEIRARAREIVNTELIYSYYGKIVIKSNHADTEHKCERLPELPSPTDP